MSVVVDELVRGYKDLLRVLRRELSAEDAADVAQSSFELALRYTQQHEVVSPAALVFRISRNLRIDASRRQKIVNFESIGELSQIEHLVVNESTPEAEHATRQRIELLKRKLDDLPAHQRETFVLCKIHGKSYEEAGRQMGIDPSLVRRYLIAAMKECRAVLD
jgi:RNA polymerase sigma-70 factor (ECF subfamily)